MANSSFWNEAQAAQHREFHYDFPEKTLAGRVVVLAGGTGGLGAATALLLAREGARLVLGFRSNREQATAVGAAVKATGAEAPALVEGDLAESAVRRAYRDAVDSLGGPPAGVAIFSGDPARVKWESLDRPALEASVASNFIGPVLLARDLGRSMEAAETGGSMVLLGTMQAVAAFESSLNYAAPKAALVQAARVLAKQWRRVRVNVVAPGATVAGMAEASVRSGKYDSFLSGGAIARFGRPEDIARAVRFFLEPDGYATGQVLVVDGGLTLRRDRG